MLLDDTTSSIALPLIPVVVGAIGVIAWFARKYVTDVAKELKELKDDNKIMHDRLEADMERIEAKMDANRESRDRELNALKDYVNSISTDMQLKIKDVHISIEKFMRDE